MGLSAKAGMFQTASSGTANIVVSDVGFQPKVLILWTNRRNTSSESPANANHGRAIGVAVSATSRFTIATYSETGQASGATDNIGRTDACLEVITDSSVDGLLDLISFDAGGFTLAVDNAFTDAWRIQYLALGGTDLTNVELGTIIEPILAGNQTEDTSFQPDALMFFSAGNANESAATDSFLMHGIAIAGGSSACIAGGSNDGAGTTDTNGHCSQGGDCIALFNATQSAINARATLSSVGATSFTLNWSAVTITGLRLVYYLALKGGSYKVGNLTTQTDTTTDIVASGFGFQPVGGMVWSACKTALELAGNVSANDEMSYGAFTSASERFCMNIFDIDGQSDSVVLMGLMATAVYRSCESSSTPSTKAVMDIKSIDLDGFSAIMDDADDAGKKAWYWAVGNAVVADNYSGRGIGRGIARGIGR